MGRRGAFGLLVAALLLVSAARCEDDEYFYDEEQEVALVPKFTSKPTDQTVMEGDNVTLSCFVDTLGDLVATWKSDTGLLFMDTTRQSNDERFQLEKKGMQGSSMIIRNVMPKDSGTYECQIMSTPPVSQKHTITVQYAPVVSTMPASGVLLVNEGSQVSMGCTAHGQPQPTVTWTKKAGLLPYDEKRHTGERLDIASVESKHRGVYICTVDGGAGEPQVRHIRLEVNFKPKITATNSVVHTGAGHSAQLECSIRGEPMPKVQWYRVKGSPLDEAHYERYQEGHAYGLRIASVRDADLGVYSCRATNKLGQTAAEIRLTGKPKPVRILSEPNGDQKDSYSLRWSVESLAPLLQYKIIYKRVQEMPGDDADGEPAVWEDMTGQYPAGAGSDDAVHTLTRLLEDLQPASVYEAIVTTSNKYGWSGQDDSTFRFSTLGANGPAGNLQGGAALKSTDPNAAVTSRGGVACILLVLMSLAAFL